MTVTHNENVIINDNLEVNGSSDEVQVIVKGAPTQTSGLQQWKDNSGTVLSEIDEDGHLLVGDQDGTIDALIESHNIEDASKPSRGLHSKGVLTGTLSSLVSWAVGELGLKGTGGISALHRALRVQTTNENTGDMDAGADVRAGDFEVINSGGNASVNNLELSALVAKINNQSGAYADKAYGLKVEIDDAGSSNDVYAIYTDNGIVHLGDLLELVAGVVLEDSATDGVLGITPRSVAPISPTSGMMYLDDGTNRTDGLVGFRRWNGSSWDDIMDTSSIGDGNVSGPGSSTDNAIARFDSTTGQLLQNSSATLDDNGKITSNAMKVNDSATTPPLNITERSTAPTTPSSGDIYLDDGTNTASGEPGWRRYTGSAWEDVGGGSGGSTILAVNTSMTATSVYGSTFVEITNGSETVTLNGSKNVRITVSGLYLSSNKNSHIGTLGIDVAGTVYEALTWSRADGSNYMNGCFSLVLQASEVSAGSTTIKVVAAKTGGSSGPAQVYVTADPRLVIEEF